MTTASSGAAALEVLSSRSFDAVICDLTMPDIGGTDIYAALVRQGRGERMILLTGGAFTDSGRAFLARFDGPVLGKPFRIRDVAQALSELQAS
ncbi:MAG: response regulator [Proteobacteria bacterium]|nr:response regulator [Pseudomonadota bacterium]MCP4917145.1 response regulator [Pseudomonadota bacterium]